MHDPLHPAPEPQMPEPVAWFRAPYGTLEPNPLFRATGPQSLEWAVPCYTEYHLREYAEALAAHRVAPLKARILELEAAHEDASGAILEAVAAERERCATICEMEICPCCHDDAEQAVADHLADAIRNQPPATGKEQR